ncbi:MAG: AbrB family transcriptional regulator, transcriptional pleiotropic regulator of transition state [Actinomycetota bacterium]|jgi:transcriptional pleiotropic regulator of transition state genes|nr:AbrB family transcriptional regulator, transcriptional pleiotropic regulator of transition state [Actinomycetota bacterium]
MARKVDDLGRIVLPAEMRRLLGIQSGDALGISIDEGTILLKKIEARCVFCETGGDDGEELVEHWGKLVCRSCAAELSSPAEGDG